MEQSYYLGLDMGTGSLGWAITDEHYHVMRKHGKDLWGVRLFESANTAEKRRMFRTARRRLDRKNWRIQVLQELFASEISRVDPGFYQRMKESKYYPEDKRDIEGKCPELPYALFVDKDYTDKDYHKQFPTIYHLRKELMETEKVPDIRLVYLAIHHMMKHRGHFLISGDISKIKEFKETFCQLEKNLKDEELEWKIEADDEALKEIEEVLKNKENTKSAKKSRLIKVLGAKSSCEKAVLTLLAGGTAKLSDIFDDAELNESERPKISFSDSGYEDYSADVETVLGEQYRIIESAKAVYDWAVLVEILGEHESISAAKVELYEKHKADLRYLKDVIRKFLSKECYKKVFMESNEKWNNYCAYVGLTKKNGTKTDLQGKCCTKEEFYEFLKKNAIKDLPDGKEKLYLETEMEQGTFMPKQVNKDNGVIPYQVHLYELKMILKNLGDKIPFLRENEEKILQLFEFRIPYYVGPLKQTEGKNNFTWAVRKSTEKVYPWNFNEVIDVEASAEEFIRRMTNKCTYLTGEDVLPKDSLLYSKYMVLNELNNLRFNGEKISVELKQRIYEELFCRHKKVTVKKLKTYLRCQGISENVEISGIDGDFKAQLTSYHDFKEKLADVSLTWKEKEQIILNIVLFGEDKKLLKKRLKNLFPELTEKQLNSIALLSYKGWGRLSKTFLENITIPAPETGEIWNIITAMWETNDNLMQLLSRNYGFSREIEEFNSGHTVPTLSYKTVEDLYVSPSVKRQIWQTLRVVEELKKVMGTEPKRIFVEMAREKQESKRTESRKKRLLDLYKACRNEEDEWLDELQVKLSNTEENQLRSDRLYLYYTQKGRCMYSGDRIPLEDLWDKNKYDIDHIYPQSKTMDDSLTNRVLVKKELNANKDDRYPIKKEIRQVMMPFWKALLKGGLIDKRKYERLVRNTELTSDELAGFIERQLVETRQSTKATAEILKEVFPDSEIVYVKAGIVSRFRKDFELIKVREMNDLHHAKDAFLNIVVGNSYYVKFTKDAVWYVKEHPGRSYNLKKMFTSSEKDIARNGEVAWKAGSNGTIVTVKKQMNKNSILVTRKCYEVKGGLFYQQIMKKGKGQVPIKSSDARLSDIEKYGGYNKATGAYYMLVKSKDKKGNEIRTLQYIPIYMKNLVEKNEAAACAYLAKERELIEPEILIKKIKTDTLFIVDGFKMWLSGRSKNRLLFKNANQLLLASDETKILKKVLKYVERKKENKNAVLSDRDDLTEEMLVQLYEVFVLKIRNTVFGTRLMAQEKTLTEKKDNFLKLSREDKCIVLSEILHMFQGQSTLSNLELIGGSKGVGSLKISNNIMKNEKISIVNQSITGIYENEVDLLTV